MNKSQLLGTVCAVLFSFVTMSANAALVSAPGGQVVYDTDRDISWMSNANLALTNQFGLSLSTSRFDDTANTVGSTGRMTWDNAMAWIDGMNAYDSGNGYLGFNNWRLPNTTQPDPGCSLQLTPGGYPPQDDGYDCTGSEMGHLFYSEFGATAGGPVLTTGDATELAKFTEIQTDYYYWSSTEYAPDDRAWFFIVENGYQSPGTKGNNFYAWAVHDGDIGAVPVPAALWLFGSGLLGLIGIARKKVT